ncbi:beta-ketoacyl synthase N-terminal-like domain-containing protein [Leptobacterium flavescens]|uniref:beta-ketoacyl synthase N-terminal-like domain-containing protein n=1 Tax=Leptobacterium flavescens TaxID=472055 RepID=UPI001952A9D3|nr:beta-ketoacyl synthase N-terminal-like domain-containing protein [Leptobacterium flavescens]
MSLGNISITAIGSVSPLGTSENEIWENYLHSGHFIKNGKDHTCTELVATIRDTVKEEVESLRNSDQKYKNLDASVLYAILASRIALNKAGWTKEDVFGINIGSSRGATSLFEKYYDEFLLRKRVSTLSSPTTTLGNISSWVAHDLQSSGPEISHSITCSTALHAVLNGAVWIQSGICNKFMAGGSEASLTPFTIAQMKAMKIYATEEDTYPCKAFDLEKTRNSMVLGEGAAVACLEKGIKENALAVIEGIGYATEPLEHNISISTNADCFQKSMKMALGDISPDEVDVIVMHAPGTIKGDLSEYNAIKKVFCNKLPALTTNKWKVGHTFGASGMLSIELAVLMLKHQTFIEIPLINSQNPPEKINRVLVNAVGFGGNAVSVLLSK